ncbi:MAG: hypothetical protein K2Q10_13705 [Rhodospirillales bacterium]|nr:hypothetical protein [Rhodospirillales bacterium]
MALHFADLHHALGLPALGLDPASISRELAAFAQEQRDQLIATGRASPSYDRSVDRVRGAPEYAVRPDGIIVYEFRYLRRVINAALTLAQQLSPKQTGRYAASWFVMVNGVQWKGGDVPFGSTVAILNDQPYHRGIHARRIGGNGKMPWGIVEMIRQHVLARFGNLVDANIQFIRLAGGYVLKGHSPRTQAGDQMTYPALIIKER